jgi:hypothetical protein
MKTKLDFWEPEFAGKPDGKPIEAVVRILDAEHVRRGFVADGFSHEHIGYIVDGKFTTVEEPTVIRGYLLNPVDYVPSRQELQEIQRHALQQRSSTTDSSRMSTQSDAVKQD